MSDATDDLEFWGRQLLRQSQSNPIRAEMRAFVSDVDPSVDAKELRRRIGDGAKLSELVDEGRDERV